VIARALDFGNTLALSQRHQVMAPHILQPALLLSCNYRVPLMARGGKEGTDVERISWCQYLLMSERDSKWKDATIALGEERNGRGQGRCQMNCGFCACCVVERSHSHSISNRRRWMIKFKRSARTRERRRTEGSITERRMDGS